MIYAVLFPTNVAKNKTANKNKLNVNIVLLKIQKHVIFIFSNTIKTNYVTYFY